MTGEMHHIDQDGNDSNGECWPTHTAIAKALGGKLQPFDVYQGPYIMIGPDMRIGERPYQLAVQNLGIIRLWIVSDDGAFGQVYREDTEKLSDSFWYEDLEAAIASAQELMA